MIKKSVGIIGSGVSGLSASIRLANMGYKVHVFEANGYPGGKLTSFKLGDYRFDAGPPLFTMPKYVDELFHLSNENPRDFFNYKKKDIICKYFWQDGKKLVAYEPLFFWTTQRSKVRDSFTGPPPGATIKETSETSRDILHTPRLGIPMNS